MSQPYDPDSVLKSQLLPTRQNVDNGRVTVTYDDLIIANEHYAVTLKIFDCVSINRNGSVGGISKLHSYSLSSNSLDLKDLTIDQVQHELNKQVCLHFYRQFDIDRLIEMNIDPEQWELTAPLVSVIMEKEIERSPNDDEVTLLRNLLTECTRAKKFWLAEEFQKQLAQFEDVHLYNINILAPN